jgi:hypothetical protein
MPETMYNNARQGLSGTPAPQSLRLFQRAAPTCRRARQSGFVEKLGMTVQPKQAILMGMGESGQFFVAYLMSWDKPIYSENGVQWPEQYEPVSPNAGKGGDCATTHELYYTIGWGSNWQHASHQGKEFLIIPTLVLEVFFAETFEGIQRSRGRRPNGLRKRCWKDV